MNLTPDIVKAFWEHMQSTYDSTVKDKRTALEMKLASVFLDALGITDREAFMNNYATTIGRTIYIPFTIGGSEWPLLNQTLVCAHEHLHVVQYDDEGEIMQSKYLANTADRAHYEIQAYRTNLELRWWLEGDMGDIGRIANNLKKNYGCNDNDVKVALKSLQLMARSVADGQVETVTGQEAIAWFERVYPEAKFVPAP